MVNFYYNYYRRFTMVYLLAYSFIGLLFGFCYDFIIFFFGRNCLRGPLFDIVLIATPLIFALIGVILFIAEHYRSRSSRGSKIFPVYILTVMFGLLGGLCCYFLGITNSWKTIIVFGLIGAFVGLSCTQPVRIWQRSKIMAYILPMITAMTVSFYCVLLFSAILIFAIIALVFLCMVFNDASAVSIH